MHMRLAAWKTTQSRVLSYQQLMLVYVFNMSMVALNGRRWLRWGQGMLDDSFDRRHFVAFLRILRISWQQTRTVTCECQQVVLRSFKATLSQVWINQSIILEAYFQIIFVRTKRKKLPVREKTLKSFHGVISATRRKEERLFVISCHVR